MLGGESNLEYQVRDLLENANPTAAIYCKTGECEIRITARAKTDTEAETMCRAYAKKFYDLLGDAVYNEDVAGLEETVVHTLQRKGLTLSLIHISLATPPWLLRARTVATSTQALGAIPA